VIPSDEILKVRLPSSLSNGERELSFFSFAMISWFSEAHRRFPVALPGKEERKLFKFIQSQNETAKSADSECRCRSDFHSKFMLAESQVL
jgi:hypothetical protein